MGLATFVQSLVERVIFGISVLFVAAIIAPSPAFASPLRIVDTNDSVVLQGNVNPLARSEFYIGATDPSLPMERIILALRMSPDKQAELDRLLDEQQDPASPNFHRWLAPEEFGEQFGLAPEDINVIIQWLTSQGFVVEEVAKSRTWINFSGTVPDVERAFQTEIRDYIVDNKPRHANASEPSIPRALIDLVAGPVSLNDFPLKAMNTGIRPLAAGDLQPNYTSGSAHYLSPGDFATIYNTNALYAAGIDGTGQSIAIVGRTHPSSTNWSTFRSNMGLPVNPPQVIVNGTDPGDVSADEDGEADLDVEWSGAVAKNATIKFVVSKSTSITDGVNLSAQYVVNNNLAPVMSASFGLCEADLGSSGNAFWNTLWSQAASQGITSLVSTGDSGAAGCSSASANSGAGLGVNGLATTPYNLAVGGTQFNEGSGSYWNSSNGTYYTSAISYIPEVAWNESGAAGNCPPGDTCSELWATSGGVSSIYGKPAWQVAPGVPADAMRDIPDVALTAAGGHDGYLVQTQGSLYSIGGTSAASPSFAGIMALIVQKTGQRQGNANIRLYQLGNAQYGSGGAVFHDITSGNNSVLGVTGYSCGVGYDLATGLGSVDANALANNWAPSRTLTVTSSNPSSGVSITVSPTDNSGLGSGTTQFTRIYNNNTAITLTAPSIMGGNNFSSWSGCDTSSGTICHVTMSASKNVIATYVTPTSTLTVTSSNPSSGASITVSPTDNSGLGSGTTQFTRIYNNYTAVTLTAPSTAGGNSFGSWSGCDSASANTCYVTLNANRTVMAIYMTPTASPVIRVENSITVGTYSTIQSAFNATVNDDIIEMHAMTFNESPNFHSNFSVLLKGGYDSSFSSQVGVTTIHGTLTVGAGTITVENLIVQ